MPPEIIILLLAMAPISELRGAIPLGVLKYGLPFWKVFGISVLGNLIAVFFALLFLKYGADFLSKHWKFFKKVFDWFSERTMKKVSDKVRKYEEIGLCLFVAIPLPFTGGWTGAIGAFILGLPFKVGFVIVSLGVLIASVIVSVLTLSGIAIEKFFGVGTLIGIVLVVLTSYLIYKFFNKKRKR
jgi:uncharacterized membrane protein